MEGDIIVYVFLLLKGIGLFEVVKKLDEWFLGLIEV